MARATRLGQPVSLGSEAGCKSPTLEDVRIRNRVYSIVTVGICLVVASCPI